MRTTLLRGLVVNAIVLFAALMVWATRGSRPVFDHTVAAVGDITCNTEWPGRDICRSGAVGRLLLSGSHEAVLLLGDNQYPSGSLGDYRRYFDGTWGFANWRQRLRPTPGNHEYLTPDARGYFAYFFGGSQQGNEYYSFDVGTWHVISLDSEIPHEPGSPQMIWLATDLRTAKQRCILAFWHRPLWSSGVTEGGSPDVSSFWDVLYPAGADVILNGHEHNYERFAPQDPRGELDPDHGIVQFVVGTGGRGLLPLGARAPGSLAGTDTTFGFLEVTLKPAGYVWRFVPASEGTYSDSGVANCHQ